MSDRKDNPFEAPMEDEQKSKASDIDPSQLTFREILITWSIHALILFIFYCCLIWMASENNVGLILVIYPIILWCMSKLTKRFDGFRVNASLTRFSLFANYTYLFFALNLSLLVATSVICIPSFIGFGGIRDGAYFHVKLIYFISVFFSICLNFPLCYWLVKKRKVNWNHH